MRAFVAVFPPLKVRGAVLAGAREAVRCPGDRLRWARPENVHLTLKFLGNVREEVLGDLRAALAEACARHAPFDVELDKLGAFPSARRARVLWAGAGAGSEELRSLAANLDAVLAPLGFEPEDRAFAPHLTLGRVRGRPAGFGLPSEAERFGFRVRCVELVESTLTPRGAVYETVETFELESREPPGP